MWLLVPIALAAEPTVDLAEEADLLFRMGVAAYRKGDYETALQRLLASHRLVPNRNVAFNLASTYEQLGQLESAWRHYDASARSETDPQARADAEQALARLDGKVARVEVATEPPGAVVYVERRDLGSRGTTPLVLALPPGEHRLLLDREGYATATTSAKLVVGKLTGLEVALVPLEAPGAPPPPEVAHWTGTVVTAGTAVLATAAPGSCAVLGVAGQPVDGPEPAAPAGSVLHAEGPRTGIGVDTTFDGRVVRVRLQRVDKRTLALADASPLHATLFARCVPADADGLARALRGLPSPVRADAVAVLAEWAAWRGAAGVADGGAACGAGDCAELAAALVR